MSAFKGLMVFYIEVGQLPPEKAEAFVNEQKAQAGDLMKKMLSEGIEAVWLPVRPPAHTRVEFIAIPR